LKKLKCEAFARTTSSQDKKIAQKWLFFLAGEVGLEPTTNGFGDK